MNCSAAVLLFEPYNQNQLKKHINSGPFLVAPFFVERTLSKYVSAGEALTTLINYKDNSRGVSKNVQPCDFQSAHKSDFSENFSSKTYVIEILSLHILKKLVYFYYLQNSY